MHPPTDDALRNRIVRLLSSSLNPPWTQRSLSNETFVATVRALQELEPEDLVGKLVVGGFTLRPYTPPDDPDGIEHSCATCLYYERHRRFCNLPELMLPVEPQWSCIVWRI